MSFVWFVYIAIRGECCLLNARARSYLAHTMQFGSLGPADAIGELTGNGMGETHKSNELNEAR